MSYLKKKLMFLFHCVILHCCSRKETPKKIKKSNLDFNLLSLFKLSLFSIHITFASRYRACSFIFSISHKWSSGKNRVMWFIWRREKWVKITYWKKPKYHATHSVVNVWLYVSQLTALKPLKWACHCPSSLMFGNWPLL